MTEREAREAILASVRAYYAQFKRDRRWDGRRIPYSGMVFDGEEMAALVETALDFTLTAGRFAEAFERQFADFIGVRHSLLVGSGSSANLLALMALTDPVWGARQLRRGDEVITVAAGFPTTVAPILQYGAVPVFVDVALPDGNLDVSQLEAALSERTRAVMVAHTLGFPFDLTAVGAFCRRHDLWLIEDNCDALGAEWRTETGWRRTGSFGDLATSSFYPAHQMTTGEGGAVYTDDDRMAAVLRSLRDWGRDCLCRPGEDNRCGCRFGRQDGELPFGYDHKYVYARLGYNLKVTEMQAAVGLAQLRKLPQLIERRRQYHARLTGRMADLGDRVLLSTCRTGGRPSPFGFLMTCKEGISRGTLAARLEARGIQTRPLFAGNLLRQPCFAALRPGVDYRVAGPLTQTDRILRDSCWVGVYPGLSEEEFAYEEAVLYETVAGC